MEDKNKCPSCKCYRYHSDFIKEGRQLKTCKTCRDNSSKHRSLCEHGKQKHNCKICSVCDHGKIKRSCRECNGCEHGKLKRCCKECVGCKTWKTKI